MTDRIIDLLFNGSGNESMATVWLGMGMVVGMFLFSSLLFNMTRIRRRLEVFDRRWRRRQFEPTEG